MVSQCLWDNCTASVQIQNNVTYLQRSHSPLTVYFSIVSSALIPLPPSELIRNIIDVQDFIAKQNFFRLQSSLY